jgi:BirA family biotin operon repressor/biotin-[acetyl-CoA-carboxylase] ligase
MEEIAFEKILAGLPLGPMRYFNRIGSTNAEAASWAEQGAPDGAWVLADEQTAGRGRSGRRWFTPPGAALAFSLVLRGPFLDDGQPVGNTSISRLTGLGAVAVSEALRQNYDLPAVIKWPNDVLVASRKTAGVLVEAQWQGGQLTTAILGIGINVTRASVPADVALNFPATCVETEAGRAVDRMALLRAVLAGLIKWRPRLACTDFLQAWEDLLAFRDEWVTIQYGQQSDHGLERTGRLLGLEPDGSLKLCDQAGQVFTVYSGEIHLRPVNSWNPSQ